MNEVRRITCRVVVRGILAALLCTVLTSCMVGPNYRRPNLEVPTGFASATTRPTTQPVLGRDWWTLFGDPTLTKLEEDAVKANTDLQAAVARVAQARAAARVTQSQFYPVVTLDPSIQRSRSSGTLNTSSGQSVTSNGTTVSRSSSSSARTTTVARIPFDVSYEVDVWGRVRRSVEAAVAQVRANEDD
ncbi:MAG: efflux system, outer rane lipoprotein NodT family, partial [Phycisphaerales bacterium]|nr:efflux system, outer rane lipoprotein NodT family [Phycisphaerales bacterium]